MKKHIIFAGTILTAVALCCAICGGTDTANTVPTPAAESAVSALCAPQMQPVKPSSNIVITEPVTQPETVEVTGSAHLLKWNIRKQRRHLFRRQHRQKNQPQNCLQLFRSLRRKHLPRRTEWSMSPVSGISKAKAPANGRSARICTKTVIRSASWNKQTAARSQIKH